MTVLLCTAVLLALGAAADSPPEALSGIVVGVADGDTLTVLVDRSPRKVRLWGIDAPEKDQPFGTRSKQALALAVAGKAVVVQVRGSDRYGRTVGWVRVGDAAVNLDQVRNGMAWWYEQYAPKATDLAQAQQQARAARKGLWVDPAPTPPWDFRRAKRQR